MPTPDSDHAAACARLAAADPVMRRLIRKHGPCELKPHPHYAPFRLLASAIANQQLNNKAAATILRRFAALFPGRRFPRPEDLALVPDAAIRGAGFSRAKIAALRDLAAKTLTGVVPPSRRLKTMSDEAIVARLTEVRGIGRWTVEMLLIFQLGRPDVLPADDFGLRQGFRLAYGLDGLPEPKFLLAHGERWRPFRSVASWYLWRVVDSAREARARKPGQAG